MNRNASMRRLWLVAGLGCGIGLQAGASAFRNPPEGAAGLGHSGGQVTLTEDASAISHNPANLADLKQAQVLPALTVINTGTKFVSPMGEAKTDQPWKVLPNLFSAWPIENTRFVAGIGVTTPFGQSTAWETDGVLHYAVPHFAEMSVVNVNPTLAMRLNERVAVGVGVDLYRSQLTLKQWVPWSAMAGVPLPEGEIKAEGDGMAVGGNAAISVKLTQKQTLALTYRCPFSIDYSGDVDVSGMPPPAGALGLSPSSDFDTTIDFPGVAALGYGLRMSDTVRVGAEVEWVQFSRYETLTLDAGNNNPLLNPPGTPNPLAPVAVPQNWDDSWTAGVGADWQATPDVTLRAGYTYLKSPIPEETVAPTLPDADRHVLSAGFGYKHGRHSIDAAYGYSIIPDLKVDSNVNPAYNGTYESHSHLMSLSYACSF